MEGNVGSEIENKIPNVDLPRHSAVSFDTNCGPLMTISNGRLSIDTDGSARKSIDSKRSVSINSHIICGNILFISTTYFSS